jgi:hypothetical protein
MKKLTLLLALVSLPVFADEILPSAPSVAVGPDTCLRQPNRSCPEDMGGVSLQEERPTKLVSAENFSMNASSFRGPRGVPDSMLDQANPEFVNRKASSPHKEASFSVGVAHF